MAHIPLPLKTFTPVSFRAWTVTGAHYTGAWYVASSFDTTYGLNGAYLDTLAAQPEGGVTASPVGSPYPYPRPALGNIYASNRNKQGCELTPAGAPFVVHQTMDSETRNYPTTMAEPWIYMKAYLTYPEAWDFAPLSGVPAPYTGQIKGFQVFVEIEVSHRDQSGTPYTQRVYNTAMVRRLDLIGSEGDTRTNSPDLYNSIYRVDHGLPEGPQGQLTPYDPWSLGGSYDLSSVTLAAGYPVALAMAYPFVEGATFGYTDNFSYRKDYLGPGVPERYRSRVVVGEPWTAPPPAAIQKFIWYWGDGSQSDVPAGATAYRYNNLAADYDRPRYLLTAASGEPVSHEFEKESTEVRVRAVDSWGRVSHYLILKRGGRKLEFSPEITLAATQSVHGEVFIAQPAPDGVAVMRTPTNTGVAQAVSQITGAKKPGIFHDAANRLHLCFLTGGAWAVYSTPDGGETWELMTASPFDSTGYGSVVPFANMHDGLVALAAVPKESSRIYFSLYNGTSWSAPRAIGSLTSGKALAAFQESFAGSSRLRVMANNLDICSLDYGETWESTP